jgi:hypothetical protein
LSNVNSDWSRTFWTVLEYSRRFEKVRDWSRTFSTVLEYPRSFVEGLKCKDWGLGFGVRVWSFGFWDLVSRFRFEGFRVENLGLRAQDQEFGGCGFGIRISCLSLMFRVQG